MFRIVFKLTKDSKILSLISDNPTIRDVFLQHSFAENFPVFQTFGIILHYIDESFRNFVTFAIHF